VKGRLALTLRGMRTYQTAHASARETSFIVSWEEAAQAAATKAEGHYDAAAKTQLGSLVRSHLERENYLLQKLARTTLEPTTSTITARQINTGLITAWRPRRRFPAHHGAIVSVESRSPGGK